MGKTSRFCISLAALWMILLAGRVQGKALSSVPGEKMAGFTLHFDFFNDWQEAERLLILAHESGANVLNVVPPPHIWEHPASLEILKKIFRQTQKWRMNVILSRIDASAPSPNPKMRDNYLYTYILGNRGVLPSGRHTPDFFRETVGNVAFEKWQKRETAYYARHFSAEPNLSGFSVGMFNEPFVSQRGSLLCYDFATDAYEIAQYTPSGRRWWRHWLEERFAGDVALANRRYRSSFADIPSIPLPKNEGDPEFGDARSAYWDWVSAINDWVEKQYRDCRAIWKGQARRNIPFILQLSGYVPEKLALGRPGLAALDIFAWMQMADALGLSLYTNAQYPDWGHASVTAMIHFLRLAVLEKKQIFVMEGGNENDGAVYDAVEMDLFAHAAQPLHPVAHIYEFLKTPYDYSFAHDDGIIVNGSWQVNQRTLAAVREALREAKLDSEAPEIVYVLDAPQRLSLDRDDLSLRKKLMAKALETPMAFVPEASLPLLPENSRLIVIRSSLAPSLATELVSRGIRVVDAKDWLNINDK